MRRQWVYPLNLYDQLSKRVDGDRARIMALLGDKATRLAEMHQWGIPVPPAFVLTAETRDDIRALDGRAPRELWRQVNSALAGIEHATGRRFGDPEDALLLSVRASATESSAKPPETILNLGIGERVAKGLAEEWGDEALAYDLYHRFIRQFGAAVIGIPAERFESILAEPRPDGPFGSEAGRSRAEWRRVIDAFKSMVLHETGREFPRNRHEQLHMAISAAFLGAAPEADSTSGVAPVGVSPADAVVVQAMVYGNRDTRSATGVIHSGATGAADTCEGEYVLHAQGQEFENGTGERKPVHELARELPQAWVELQSCCHQLQRLYGEPQEIEFTIESGKLWILESHRA